MLTLDAQFDRKFTVEQLGRVQLYMFALILASDATYQKNFKLMPESRSITTQLLEVSLRMLTCMNISVFLSGEHVLPDTGKQMFRRVLECLWDENPIRTAAACENLIAMLKHKSIASIHSTPAQPAIDYVIASLRKPTK